VKHRCARSFPSCLVGACDFAAVRGSPSTTPVRPSSRSGVRQQASPFREGSAASSGRPKRVSSCGTNSTASASAGIAGSSGIASSGGVGAACSPVTAGPSAAARFSEATAAGMSTPPIQASRIGSGARGPRASGMNVARHAQSGKLAWAITTNRGKSDLQAWNSTIYARWSR
jgi:hypothetical protein